MKNDARAGASGHVGGVGWLGETGGAESGIG